MLFSSLQNSSLRTPSVTADQAVIREEEFSRRPDAYGVFLWWPDEEAHEWLHPYDRPLASDWLPGERVWQRHRGQGDFDLVCHGPLRFRAKPRLWMNVPPAEFWVGDWIEVLSSFRRRPPFVARIAEVFWDRGRRRHTFLLDRHGRRYPDRYTADQLVRCRPLVDSRDHDDRAETLSSPQRPPRPLR